jgi:hypothetical protein
MVLSCLYVLRAKRSWSRASITTSAKQVAQRTRRANERPNPQLPTAGQQKALDIAMV